MREKNILILINKYRTAIMGAAAIWILIFHGWQPLMGKYPSIYWVESFVKKTGFSGVEIFLFLSGMGLVYSIQKHNIITFYKRRLLRAFIPFFVIAAIMAFYYDWSLATFCRNLFGISFYAESLFIFLWFGTAIFTIYLLFPLYYFLFSKASDKAIFTIGALIVWLLLSVYFSDIMREDLYGFTNRLPVFMVGVLAGWISRNGKLVMDKLSWCVCWLILLSGLYFMYLTSYREYFLVVPKSNCCIPTFLIAISLICILAKLFEIVEKHFLILGKGILKCMTFMGALSLELYCVQEWLWENFVSKLEVGSLVGNLLFIAGSIVAALMLHGICNLIQIILNKIGMLLTGKADV